MIGFFSQTIAFPEGKRMRLVMNTPKRLSSRYGSHDHVTSRHLAEHANASASPNAHHIAIDGPVGIRAPRVGAFPPAPRDGENCDVGDNPFIC